MNSQTTTAEPVEARELPDGVNVFSTVVSAFQEQGFEAGYARGINDALAAVLEASDEFARMQPLSVAETRKLLYAFSRFLEERIRQSRHHRRHEFVDGLGI
ncbi:MAG: hypothetical protein ABSF29_13595 [Tepidisphaeraceae bacterium]|jgi:hypothetical protein